jgi:hypothetical protein
MNALSPKVPTAWSSSSMASSGVYIGMIPTGSSRSAYGPKCSA